jgi:serine/threonine protein kinase
MNAPVQDAKDIFGEALAFTDPAERAAYLERACAGNAALRQEVDSLLQAHEQAGSFLHSSLLLPPEFEQPGARIGRYTVLEKLGEGGCGVVYLAEQAEPVQRKVALKIIKPGMDSREIIARFQAESEALALLDHPNIARPLDGGTTEGGRPFFVMELVRGLPITDYCDQGALSITARIKLFLKVCAAVQHAHEHGFVHRDLKPGNVLVARQEHEVVPKVIDFGVAKALEQRLTENTVVTGYWQLLGTPAYMSPEQADLSGLAIDGRADVYSLGVLLYELLTGVTPLDKEMLKEAGPEEIRHLLREVEPLKPSARLQTLGDQLSMIAMRRGTDAPSLRRRMRGDLDCIVMKCLQKERPRRYDTPEELAADLARLLKSQPIEARPPSVSYVAGKWLRRHRLPVAVAGAVAATLILAAVAVGVLGLRRPRQVPAAQGPASKPGNWEALFDGTSTAAFRGFRQVDFPSNDWVITAEGELKTVPGTPENYILTTNEYESFELVWEWKTGPGGNSGMIYRAQETYDRPSQSGPEYQLLDDAYASVPPNQTSGAAYGLIPPSADKMLRLAGEWNEGRLLVQGNHVEHWMNGRKLLEYEFNSPAFTALVSASPRHNSYGRFARETRGHIALQNWTPEVWFRNIRIRPIEPVRAGTGR